MLPLELRARGFKGLRNLVSDGELAVDLRPLRGMVGIRGDNGMGKTTFLELLQPHRMMVSRQSESLKSQVFLPDSFKDITFRIGDKIFRSLTRINARTGKTSAFMWEDGTPLNDSGNCDLHDEIMSRICGTPELFFSSVFCAQKGSRSKKITELTKGKKKGLFVQFLNLAWLEERQAVAKAIRDVLNTKLREIEGQTASVRGRILSEDPALLEKAIEANAFNIERFTLNASVIRERISDLQKDEERLSEVGRAETEKDARKKAILEEVARIDARVDMATAKIKDLGLEQSRIRIQDLASEPEAIRKKINQAETMIKDAEISQSRDSETLKKHEDDLEAAQALARKELEIAGEEKGIRGKIDSHRRHRTEIQTSLGIAEGRYKLEEKRSDLVNRISGLKDQLTSATEKLASCKKSMAQLEDLTGAELEIDLQRGSLTSRIEALSKQADIINRRPAECRIDGCAFIKGALEAGVEIIELKKQIESLLPTRDVDTRNGDFAALEREERKAQKEIDDTKEAIGKLESELSHVSRSIGLAGQSAGRIRQIDDDIVRLEEDLRALPTPDSQKTQTMINAARAGIQREKEYLDKAREKIKKYNAVIAEESDHLRSAEVAQERIRSIEEAIATAETAIVTDRDFLARRKAEGEAIVVDWSWKKRLDDSRDARKVKEFELSDLQKRTETMRIEMARMRTNLEADRQARAELKKIEERRATLARESGEWDTLQSLCGRDRLQAFEMDASAPIISGTANDLLRATFGDQFSIRFQTLKDGKEVFDVLVYDQRTGEEKNLEDISGGEEVWILKALRLAFILLTKDRSGKIYHALFGDEEDGRLSIENRMAYLQMYRRMLVLGGFDVCYLVSHTPELTGACDHRITFRQGGVDVD